MFTGIVLHAGRVESLRGGRLRLRAALPPGRSTPGASVAVDGVCLTVAARRGRLLEFDLGPETLARTSLGGLRPGDRVHLEPALRAGDPVGGHWVSGHVDARGRVLSSRPLPGGCRLLTFELSSALRGLVASQGSVAVDGVSLTVARVGRGRFELMLVPHTLKRTRLGQLRPGDRANLEADMLARYARAALDSLRGGAKGPGAAAPPRRGVEGPSVSPRRGPERARLDGARPRRGGGRRPKSSAPKAR